MKKILLILSYLRYTQSTVTQAIRIAKEENAELIALFVVDIEFANGIVHKLTDEGWIGGKPSQQFYGSLLKEYELQAKDKIAEIEKQAAEHNIRMQAIIKNGPLLREVLKLVELEEPDLIMITRRRRSNLSRKILGSLPDALSKQVDCEVKIIDAD